jgi:TM2 domain-containing membrane protein YozV
LKKSRLLSVILILLIQAQGFVSRAQQDIFSAESGKRYAIFLEQAQRYQEAAIEWERVALLKDYQDSACSRVISNYRSAGQAESAIRYYRGLKKKGQESGHAFALAALSQQRPDTGLLRRELSTVLPEQRIQLYLSLAAGMSGKWSKSGDEIGRLALPENDGLPVGRLSMLMKEAGAKPEKKPWLAGCMSAIIPGTGKFYTGDVADGIMGLVFVGSTAFQCYRGFSKQGVKSARGWIFGTLSLGFYTGNIYGSVKAAKRKNQKKRDVYRKKVVDLLAGDSR